MKRKILYLSLMLILLLFIVSSCTCQNPLSGLSWGKALLRGQVIYEYSRDPYPVYAGVEGVMVYTDVGNDFTYTISKDDPDSKKVSKINKYGGSRTEPLEPGEFELEVRFRIGSTAKSKKITVYAYREDFPSIQSVSGITVIDGQATIPVIIKVPAPK